MKTWNLYLKDERSSGSQLMSAQVCKAAMRQLNVLWNSKRNRLRKHLTDLHAKTCYPRPPPPPPPRCIRCHASSGMTTGRPWAEVLCGRLSANGYGLRGAAGCCLSRRLL